MSYYFFKPIYCYYYHYYGEKIFLTVNFTTFQLIWEFELTFSVKRLKKVDQTRLSNFY